MCPTKPCHKTILRPENPIVGFSGRIGHDLEASSFRCARSRGPRAHFGLRSTHDDRRRVRRAVRRDDGWHDRRPLRRSRWRDMYRAAGRLQRRVRGASERPFQLWSMRERVRDRASVHGGRVRPYLYGHDGELRWLLCGHADRRDQLRHLRKRLRERRVHRRNVRGLSRRADPVRRDLRGYQQRSVQLRRLRKRLRGRPPVRRERLLRQLPARYRRLRRNVRESHAGRRQLRRVRSRVRRRHQLPRRRVRLSVRPYLVRRRVREHRKQPDELWRMRRGLHRRHAVQRGNVCDQLHERHHAVRGALREHGHRLVKLRRMRQCVRGRRRLHRGGVRVCGRRDRLSRRLREPQCRQRELWSVRHGLRDGHRVQRGDLCLGMRRG